MSKRPRAWPFVVVGVLYWANESEGVSAGSLVAEICESFARETDFSDALQKNRTIRVVSCTLAVVLCESLAREVAR